MPTTDRREENVTDLAEIWNLLRALDKKIDLHLQEENAIRPKLLQLIDALELSKGAFKFIKLTAAIVAASAAVYTYVSTYIAAHITWRL